MATVNFGNGLTTFADEAGNFQGTGASLGTLSDGIEALIINDTGTNQGTWKIPGLDANGLLNFANGASVTNNYLRFYIQVITLPTSNTEMFVNIIDINDHFLFRLQFNSSGNIQIFDSTATNIFTSTTALVLNDWYRIECLFTIGGNNPWGLKIAHSATWPPDGAFIETQSGNGNFGTLVGKELGLGKDQNSFSQPVVCNIRDWFWSDSGYPGPGHSAILVPINDGFYTNGTAVGAATRWQCVKEIPRDDDTTYVNGLTSGQAYTARMGTLFGTINSVKAYARARSNDGVTNCTYNVRLRSGTVDTDTTDPTVGNLAYTIHQKIFDTDPATGLPWTQAGLNVAQVGFIQNGAGAVRGTVVYLLVDYLVGPAPLSFTFVESPPIGNRLVEPALSNRISESPTNLAQGPRA